MRSSQYLRAGAVGLALGAALLVGGCSTGASMLVEVDVYKGPLGKSKNVQAGELVAVFKEAIPLLDINIRTARVHPYDCNGHQDVTGCVLLREAAYRADEIRTLMFNFVVKYEGRLTELAVLLTRLEKARANGATTEQLKAMVPEDPEIELQAVVIEATKLATRLKVDAFYFSESQIGGFPESREMRRLLVGFTNLMSELSNQIASRTDTLIKQVNLNVKGSELALSDHLKDAGPTDFLYLYDWYQATLPNDALSVGENALTPADRARLARRLFSDHYWTRINSVHASGQGDVSMALIKDDIGNWNLKSFDNNPEKLLEAYRNLSLAGIEAAIKLSTGTGAANVELLSQFARGRVGSTQTAVTSSARIDSMRARAVVDLEAVRDAAASSDARALADNEALAKRRLNGATDEVARLRMELALSTGDNEEKQQALDQALARERQEQAALRDAQDKHRAFMADLFAQARKALEVHRRVIDGLKEMQGASPTLTPAAAVLGR